MNRTGEEEVKLYRQRESKRNMERKKIGKERLRGREIEG